MRAWKPPEHRGFPARWQRTVQRGLWWGHLGPRFPPSRESCGRNEAGLLARGSVACLPGERAPSGGVATSKRLLQWRGRAGIAPDFRVAAFAESIVGAVYREQAGLASGIPLHSPDMLALL